MHVCKQNKKKILHNIYIYIYMYVFLGRKIHWICMYVAKNTSQKIYMYV